MKLNFYILLLCLSSIGITSWGRNATPTSHLTVLQLNIWHEGSIVEGGFEAIADEVAQVDAYIVFSAKSATTMAPSLYPASLRHLRNVEKLTMENITLWM